METASDHCIKGFEHDIFCDKQKMTSNEAFFFRAGIHAALISPQIILAHKGHDEATNWVRDLMTESKNFEQELKSMHSMFCDNCELHGEVN